MTHRVYCIDCGKHIYECPQEEYKQEQKMQKESHVRGRPTKFDLGARDDKLTREEVKELASRLPGHLKLQLRRNPDRKTFDMHEIEAVVQEVIDAIKESDFDLVDSDEPATPMACVGVLLPATDGQEYAPTGAK